MPSDVAASLMLPFSSSPRHEPPLLDRVRSAVPRRHCSYWALRLLVLVGRRFGCPSQCGPPLARCSSVSAAGAPEPAARRRLRSGSPLRLLSKEEHELSRVTGPPFSDAPRSKTPPNAPPPTCRSTPTSLLPSGATTPWAFGNKRFRGFSSRLTTSPTYASPRPSLIPSQG